MDQDVYDLL